MQIQDYFAALNSDFEKVYSVAKSARAKGLDPKPFVEIKPAPDLASRVEGIIGIEGLADIIKAKFRNQSRTELAFEVTKQICIDKRFESYETLRRIEAAIRVGLAILTEGILVAPTEGVNGVERYKNPDGSDYLAVIYAGPIRGAGGTAAALSVALADYARKFFDIGEYRATKEEIDRYVEEVELYDVWVARLQYKPTEEDLRVIVSSCPICVDGLAKEETEVSVRRDIKRIDATGKEVPITNRIRGGGMLVLCEGIAQKAKKVSKETKAYVDWDWLNKVIKVGKVDKTPEEKIAAKKGAGAFLEEIVAGRPILSYPGFVGGFRLRYGRSRFTGIASKGVHPATMILTDGFVAMGTQVKVEYPGKGCIMMPVDSIEGPFVKLKNGDAVRVESVEQALEVKSGVVEILSLGDMLVTYGDFKKSNNILQPSSYVSEMWEQELIEKNGSMPSESGFEAFFDLSIKYSLPLHPKYLYEFQAVSKNEIERIANEIFLNAVIEKSGDNLSDLKSISIREPLTKRSLEIMLVPHRFVDGKAVVEGDFAKALLVSFGFVDKEQKIKIDKAVLEKYYLEYEDALSLINSVSPVKIMKRSTFIGARIGRPEKAKERLMKPAPHVLFPLGNYAGKERNVTKAYGLESRKFGDSGFLVEIAIYYCDSCKRLLDTPYCYDCELPGRVKRICNTCNKVTDNQICERCNVQTFTNKERRIDIKKVVFNSMKRLKTAKMPDVVKGVLGLTNKDKMIEPLEKGMLRSQYGIYIFKDGTARFDATDVPITHFYPKEIGISVEKTKELGYNKDYLGNELTSSEQLIEMRHQDVILNRRGAEYLLKVSNFVDDLLERFYGIEKFYNAKKTDDLLGHLVITLSPHTSCAVLGRIIGFTDASIGFAHPYTISARRRNCDGDEDTTMLLMDSLINFSRAYLPSTIGGTMDAPLILTLNIMPEEVDDEVYSMEVVQRYPMEFYNKAMQFTPPGEVKIEIVEDRLKNKKHFDNLNFTHLSSVNSLSGAPKRSSYTTFKTMKDKVDAEFRLMDMLYGIDRRDAAKKLIMSHFIPDLIGNLHSFSRQRFRCVSCNAKYRRIPLSGKCRKDGGKLLLTISKGGVEKYLEMAIMLGERYELEPYIRQRLQLVKEDINNIFGENVEGQKQFDLSRYM